MIEDFINCFALGTISSKIKVTNQKESNQMISFSLNVAVHNEKITVKMFDQTPDFVEYFQREFSFGDKIKITGDVKCDSYIVKDKLVKGICIIPKKVELVEKTTLHENKEIQIKV